MSDPWLIIIAGVIFSLTGVFLFHRDAFEKNGRVLIPLIITIAGVILMSIGFAKHLKLIE
jgi:hypothetical protein